MRKILIICVFVFSSVNCFLQAQSLSSVITRKMCRDSLLSGNIGCAVKGYAALVESAKLERTGTKGVDADLLAEYAYALALYGACDGAFVALDKAGNLGSEYFDFYVAQICALAGYPELSSVFMTESGNDIPDWISRSYKMLADQYGSSNCRIVDNDIQRAFKRANTLGVNKQYAQSIILFQKITDACPNMYLPYVGYSTVWEKLGFYEKAAEELQTGINLMEKSDSTVVSIFQNHLIDLHNIVTDNKNRTFLGKLSDRYEPSFMFYAGGSVGKRSFSINSRLGFYTNNKISGSINIGYSRISGQNALNIGLAAYKTVKIFIFGLGINERISNNSVFSITPSSGISIMNKKGNASYDVMFNLYIPVIRENPVSYGLSFGRTFYFDFKFKKK